MRAAQVVLVQGDITRQRMDAIVNAANSSLMGGGGVDGAIHRAGGPAILEACRRVVAAQGSCPVGQAVITTGGNLPAKYVIHTVGPVWKGGNQGEEALLYACYQNALRLAEENDCKSIAFPNISTGIYGYPKADAAATAIRSVKAYKSKSIEQVFFTCFDEANYKIYKGLLGY